jgi:hypothetical protein
MTGYEKLLAGAALICGMAGAIYIGRTAVDFKQGMDARRAATIASERRVVQEEIDRIRRGK